MASALPRSRVRGQSSHGGAKARCVCRVTALRACGPSCSTHCERSSVQKRSGNAPPSAPPSLRPLVARDLCRTTPATAPPLCWSPRESASLARSADDDAAPCVMEGTPVWASSVATAPPPRTQFKEALRGLGGTVVGLAAGLYARPSAVSAPPATTAASSSQTAEASLPVDAYDARRERVLSVSFQSTSWARDGIHTPELGERRVLCLGYAGGFPQPRLGAP